MPTIINNITINISGYNVNIGAGSLPEGARAETLPSPWKVKQLSSRPVHRLHASEGIGGMMTCECGATLKDLAAVSKHEKYYNVTLLTSRDE